MDLTSPFETLQESADPFHILRIRQAFRHHRAHTVPDAHLLKRASVAGIFRQPRHGSADLLFIQRAERPGDPWSGHMAFPGGRREPEDRNTRATAERETREELGLDLGSFGDKLGRSHELMASARGKPLPLVITPYLYQLREEVELTPNEEVAEALWVPLSRLADRDRRRTMPWRVAGTELQLPCLPYEGRVIWGLTLKMVDDMLEVLGR